MTPKQRARQATEPEYLEALSRARLNKAIERAIIAAVEADRASRECCKAKFIQTREACATIAANKALITGYNTAIEIYDEIRAQSE